MREEKTPQIHISHSHQLGSNPSIYSGGIGHGSQHSTGSLDQVTSPTSHSTKPINTGEDLYSWMAKQQEFIKDNDKGNLKGNWVSLVTIIMYNNIYIPIMKCQRCILWECKDLYMLETCLPSFPSLRRSFVQSKSLQRYI